MVSRALVSSAWLSSALKATKAPWLQVVDCTWSSPGSGDARLEYGAAHIPGALYFDLDQCKDQASPYEMMLPTPSRFAEYAGSLGITNQSQVVVYDCDAVGMMAAPRLWWMFRVFGHNRVAVLDGGLVNWVKRGLPVTSETTPVRAQTFHATMNRALVKTFQDVQENLSSKTFQLVDARGEGRFRGPEPKPGEGIEPGHIRGSLNLPFSALLTSDGFQRPPHEMLRLFQEKGVELQRPVTATCRRGVTACHLALAAFVLGKEDTAVYDGSWAEWFHRAKAEDKVFERRNRA